MPKSPNTAQATDAVDWFAQQILRHPERADDLKQGLRQQIGLETGSASPEAVDLSDPEDFWDNVPV
jgi:hypothetical protein